MELSIIIPVYNAEKYLSECLDSVASCSLKNMECILVNDGSVDSSEAICLRYLEQDQRFQLISMKNSGVSMARNAGLEAATGSYVMFLDADDYMDRSAWPEIIKMIQSRDYDFIAYSYYTLYEDRTIRGEPFEGVREECDDMAVIRDCLLTSSRLNTCWAKLFNLELIRRNGLAFREELKIGEDFIFVLEYLNKCSRGLLKNMPVLYYRQHEGSAMRRYDFDTRLDYIGLLLGYSKEAVSCYEESRLIKGMYHYYFRVITNLFLEFSSNGGRDNLNKEYRRALARNSVSEIISHTDLSGLPFYKKLEAIMLRRHWCFILSGYFKLKALFL